MAHKLNLRWSTRALQQLSHILDRLSTANPGAARKLAKAIQSNLELLREYPQLGRKSLDGQRELVVHKNYLITYRVKEDAVEGIQIWHAAQHRFR